MQHTVVDILLWVSYHPLSELQKKRDAVLLSSYCPERPCSGTTCFLKPILSRKSSSAISMRGCFMHALPSQSSQTKYDRRRADPLWLHHQNHIYIYISNTQYLFMYGKCVSEFMCLYKWNTFCFYAEIVHTHIQAYCVHGCRETWERYSRAGSCSVV